MTSLQTLTGKVVVITGAGSGMGREMARLSAQHGARLAIADWNAESLSETVDLIAAIGGEVRGDVIDVADRTAVAAWAAAVAKQFGQVNVVVNNAGVTMTGDFTDMTYADFDWIVGVNFTGVVNGTKEFLPHLIASGEGTLINISSLFGLMSVAGQTGYNATKFAVRGFTEALRQEMLIAAHPVTVTCVHPGGVKTGISRNGRKVAGLDPAAIDRAFDKVARMEPERAADLILRAGLAGKPRLLIGIDAHLIHNVVRLVGARYQDVAAKLTARQMAPSRGHRRDALLK